MQVGYCTDRGKNRERNEDAFLIMKKERIFLVADGVGGQNAGELASGAAVRLIGEHVQHFPPEDCADENEIRDYFLDCLERTNDAIFQIGGEAVRREGMATTAVLLYLRDGKAYVVNVGDSRAYLLREGRLHQLTEDHTFVNQMLKEGNITATEAEHHPGRHMITRALGGEERIQPDFFRLSVFEGDLLLLCTDGLYNELSEERMEALVGGETDMQALAELLVREANASGGGDNITAVCIRIDIGEEEV